MSSQVKDINDLPNDVLWASLIGTASRHVGLETYKKLIATYKKYPDYFPWENTFYHKVPKEVHREFSNELSDFNKKNKFISPIQKKGEHITDFLCRQWDSLGKHEEFIKKNKKLIWKKHYKKYGLKYYNYS